MVKKMTKWFYLQPFLFTREQLHLLDISRKLNENHATVRKYLNEFAKEGMLKITQKGRLTLYEINFDFPLIIDYLTIAEKEFLIQKKATKPLIIFGSSVNEFSKAKDIDIICLENLNLTNLKKKYTKEFHVIQVKNLKQIQETLKQEILKKHIIVNGTEETIKWLI